MRMVSRQAEALAAGREPDRRLRFASQQALDEATDAEGEPAQAQLSTEETERQQAMEHLLQRVPDDPGGLLRRKFQLEFQRRQQEGGRR